jgi:WD40 repeat protein
LKPVRLTAPSFKLRKSSTIVFSGSGRYLGQIGKRVFVWDTVRRELASDFKVISNESGLAVSRDEAIVAVKATSGEIVFVDLVTGNPISRTGKYRGRQEGPAPLFLSEAPLLLDGDWSGMLRLFDPSSARAISSSGLDGNYMITRIAGCAARRRFAVAANAKHDQRGGDRLLLYDEPIDLSRPTYVLPRAESQVHDGGWRNIRDLAMHADGDQIAVVLDGRTARDPNTIELFSLSGKGARTILLPSRSHYVHGIAWSASGVLCVSVFENLYKPGQTLEDQIRNRDIDHCHICFYSDTSLALIARWLWSNAWSVAFAPEDVALAIASMDEPGAYIAKKHLVSAGLPFE